MEEVIITIRVTDEEFLRDNKHIHPDIILEDFIEHPNPVIKLAEIEIEVK